MATIVDMTEEKALKVKDFEFTYAGADAPSIKKLTMPIAKHSITALIGPSGCGKTTLQLLLCRLEEVIVFLLFCLFCHDILIPYSFPLIYFVRRHYQPNLPVMYSSVSFSFGVTKSSSVRPSSTNSPRYINPV